MSDWSAEITPALVAAAVALVVALITALITAAVKLRNAGRMLREDVRLDFAPERLVRRLLSRRAYRRVSFEIIKSHLGGFDDDELRKILVRAGAVRLGANPAVPADTEIWGLLERNWNFARRSS